MNLPEDLLMGFGYLLSAIDVHQINSGAYHMLQSQSKAFQGFANIEQALGGLPVSISGRNDSLRDLFSWSYRVGILLQNSLYFLAHFPRTHHYTRCLRRALNSHMLIPRDPPKLKLPGLVGSSEL